MRQKLPYQLLVKHQDLSINEIRTIINTIMKAKTYRIKSSHIIDFNIPLIGRVKSHGNKKVKRYRKQLIKDRKKKRALYRKKSFLPENLLF